MSIIIISGPSGSGQDSVIKGIERKIKLEKVITTTTRAMRPGESQKNPYYFISKDKFKKGIKNNDFFEYACEYNNNYYGVTHKEINRAKKNKKINIWKIEYKGVITAKKLMPETKAILITAPIKILEKRIRKRDKNKGEKYIKERIEYSKKFLKYKNIYDYKVINKERKLQETINKTADIIKSLTNS
ncbi:MAG: hypothetical protein ABIA02_01635 [Candidatus Falkowbacteria bacterium]